MFKLKFAHTYDFGVMIKYKLDHVIEDYYTVSDNAFCVADGITRECTDGTTINYPHTLEEAEEIIKKYPNPSGATKAAHICGDNFIKYASEIDLNNISEKDLLHIAKKINKDIKQINKNRKIDYLTEDLYGCVAVGGIFTKDFLYAFAIGDSNIRILDKDFNIILDTTSKTLSLDYKPNKLTSKLYKGKWNWSLPKYRIHLRKVVRNNPILQFFKHDAYGALTGQVTATPFIKTFKIPLDNVKYIFVHSDGCESLLKTKEQMQNVLLNPTSIQEEIHEKTLLIYEKED